MIAVTNKIISKNIVGRTLKYRLINTQLVDFYKCLIGPGVVSPVLAASEVKLEQREHQIWKKDMFSGVGWD